MSVAGYTERRIDWQSAYITGFRADLDRGYLTLIHAPPALRLLITINRLLIEGTTPMAITITDTQKFTATVTAVDARGNPATLDGPANFTVSDETLLFLANVSDLSADVLAIGPLGNAQLVVVADADLGEGIRTIQGVLDVTVVSGEAVSLNIVTSVPVEQSN